MNRSDQPPPIYPAYCFRLSPTYNAWVKLTIADVHQLRTEPGFEGQNLFFYHNHPIRFVRVVGLVLAIDDINSRYTFLTLDDGSGRTIEVKIVRDPPSPGAGGALDGSSTTTAVDGLDVVSRPGVFDVVLGDRWVIDVGTVIKAKCTVGTWRDALQLELKRVSVVETTGAEARAWAETAAFRRRVLGRPWVLSVEEVRGIERALEEERRGEERRVRERAERERRRAEKRRVWEGKMRRYEEKMEVRRRKEEVIMNAGALI